jgi:hypothetical protein
MSVITPLIENEHGKGYSNAIKCPKCGYEISGLQKVLDFINDEIIYEDYQYDDYECPDCLCLLSFNTENIKTGEIVEWDEKCREILSIDIWVWNDYE